MIAREEVCSRKERASDRKYPDADGNWTSEAFRSKSENLIKYIIKSFSKDIRGKSMTWEQCEARFFSHAPFGSGGKLDRIPGLGKNTAQISKCQLRVQR